MITRALLPLIVVVIAFFGPPSTLAPTESKSETSGSERLLGELRLPFDGSGRVSFRADGLVLIDAGVDDGCAFYANLVTQFLVEEEGRVTLRSTNTQGKTIHQFAPVSRLNAARRSEIASYVGALELDYDDVTDRLTVRISESKQDFAATFLFRNAQWIETDAAAAALADGEGCTCECAHYGPPGGTCNACNRCPEGYVCSCKCGEGGCSCRDCRRPRAFEVTYSEELPPAGHG